MAPGSNCMSFYASTYEFVLHMSSMVTHYQPMIVFAIMGSDKVISISYWEVNDLIIVCLFGFVLFDLWPEK